MSQILKSINTLPFNNKKDSIHTTLTLILADSFVTNGNTEFEYIIMSYTTKVFEWCLNDAASNFEMYSDKKILISGNSTRSSLRCDESSNCTGKHLRSGL